MKKQKEEIIEKVEKEEIKITRKQFFSKVDIKYHPDTVNYESIVLDLQKKKTIDEGKAALLRLIVRFGTPIVLLIFCFFLYKMTNTSKIAFIAVILAAMYSMRYFKKGVKSYELDEGLKNSYIVKNAYRIICLDSVNEVLKIEDFQGIVTNIELKKYTWIESTKISGDNCSIDFEKRVIYYPVDYNEEQESSL